ncbi:MAG: tRNA (guanosine(37)-N1)-methyltransferase TrmD [Bacteroidetes Order II. Incertae sedis bacterium]|jgi:tRNA (guanine37-N1)-methyltransferase|nr:tRNA (guanosine(37)-N1)-methyltransferase TrmD [Bacteroidetes Order II. bacterium]MBT4603415.1 tRNA (guanosine(37)-N1)-methyltransferase TrmD [Bacteroidetes Order II. bacterium]MBT5249675.1 tRNA (guanosine(37)-N1)-methyltransferase TrmD [Bacteroidetes Order II. bacterium]MBT6200241.1 tRNA (guanosine(37)-N1)-methyltransferase TrmD [Bacteroidetes Order II. bacterium]MBT6423513.1 tRNA (guanosine(37)-N1)-methyltransferase TrmD [Bacteroidetes Order II. bacterium]
MHVDIITALPEIIGDTLDASIPGRAQRKGLLSVQVHDLREWAFDKHRQVDDYPYGGGAGMVLKPEPIFACYDHLTSSGEEIDEFIFLTPDGEVLTQSIANELSLRKRVVMLAGHYKGVDQRVRDTLVTREISVGDYVLSGGELPAMMLVDAIARLIPGVLGDASSALTDSFQDGFLDAPVYTRPATFRSQSVPDVLLSGDHSLINAWRDDQRAKKTKLRRPDLLDGSPIADSDSD